MNAVEVLLPWDMPHYLARGGFPAAYSSLARAPLNGVRYVAPDWDRLGLLPGVRAQLLSQGPECAAAAQAVIHATRADIELHYGTVPEACSRPYILLLDDFPSSQQLDSLVSRLREEQCIGIVSHFQRVLDLITSQFPNVADHGAVHKAHPTLYAVGAPPPRSEFPSAFCAIGGPWSTETFATLGGTAALRAFAHVAARIDTFRCYLLAAQPPDPHSYLEDILGTRAASPLVEGRLQWISTPQPLHALARLSERLWFMLAGNRPLDALDSLFAASRGCIPLAPQNSWLPDVIEADGPGASSERPSLPGEASGKGDCGELLYYLCGQGEGAVKDLSRKSRHMAEGQARGDSLHMAVSSVIAGHRGTLRKVGQLDNRLVTSQHFEVTGAREVLVRLDDRSLVRFGSTYAQESRTLTGVTGLRMELLAVPIPTPVQPLNWGRRIVLAALKQITAEKYGALADELEQLRTRQIIELAVRYPARAVLRQLPVRSVLLRTVQATAPRTYRRLQPGLEELSAREVWYLMRRYPLRTLKRWIRGVR